MKDETGAIFGAMEDDIFLNHLSYKVLQEFLHLRKGFWGLHVWALGYFCCSSGNVTDEIIAAYIEDQKHEEDAEFGVEGEERLKPQWPTSSGGLKLPASDGGRSLKGFFWLRFGVDTGFLFPRQGLVTPLRVKEGVTRLSVQRDGFPPFTVTESRGYP